MKKSLGPLAIVYPCPVFVVGSYDENGKPNVMTVAWGGICCSDPPSISISIRKATYSYRNIMTHKAFTVNIPSEDFAKEADYIGIITGKKKNKFETLGITPIKSDKVNAPYVKEFPFILECEVIHIFEIGSHTQFIGRILDVKANKDSIGEMDVPDITKLTPILFDPGNQRYYSIGRLIGKAFSIGKEVTGQKE